MISNNIDLSPLLIYNLEKTARQFSLIDTITKKPTDSDISKYLNLAEYLSRQPGDTERILAFTIVALIWENRDQEWLAISSFISRVLINLGLITSSQMIDWDSNENLFPTTGSFFEDIFSSIKLNKSERKIGKYSLLLSDTQKRIWDAIDTYKCVGISAPTSAGKSFVITHKAVEVLRETEGSVLFIVPTISLINQVTRDLRHVLKKLNITDVFVSQTVNEASFGSSKKNIFVLTQERALSAISHSEDGLNNLKLLIVDEIQNIEKVVQNDEERSKILFDAINNLKNDKNPEKIVICGPRLSNIQDLVKRWFGNEAQSVSDLIPSVLNISYTFKKQPRSKKIVFSQYLPLNISNSIIVSDRFSFVSNILGKQKYSANINEFIFNIYSAGKNDGLIIFAGKTKEANVVSESFSNFIREHSVLEVKNHYDSLKHFLSLTVHPQYSMISTLECNVAYHHSKVPSHVRMLVEKLFQQKKIDVIVSTTTLMQGVNLPAKNIIIRNPSLGIEKLSGYEFANLKGRAGRLTKDLVGRAILLDEEMFEDNNIDLFSQQEKSIEYGYGSKFNSNKNSILSALQNDNLVAKESADINNLIVYIRIIAIKYGLSGLNRLEEVGIKVDPKMFNELVAKFQSLSIPLNYCINNPYWDPLILEKIYSMIKRFEWPNVPVNTYSIAKDIVVNLEEVGRVTPYYFEKYLGMKYPVTSRKLLSLAIMAEAWAQGVPLAEVINPSTWVIGDSQDIENRIADIQKSVVFGIPKLLRPIFQIYDDIHNSHSSTVLSCIELGANSQLLKILIEVGIPRETAIDISKQLSVNAYVDESGNISSSMIKKIIDDANNLPQLNEWHKFLIEDM